MELHHTKKFSWAGKPLVPKLHISTEGHDCGTVQQTAATGKAHLRPKGHDVDAQPVALLRVETLEVAEQSTCAVHAACEHVTWSENVRDRVHMCLVTAETPRTMLPALLFASRAGASANLVMQWNEASSEAH